MNLLLWTYQYAKAHLPNRIKRVEDFFFLCVLSSSALVQLPIALGFLVLGQKSQFWTLVVGNTLCVLSLIWWLGGARKVHAHTLFHLSLLGLVFAIALQTGGMDSASLAWLSLITLAPFFLISHRRSQVWALVTLLALFGFFSWHWLNWEPMYPYDTRTPMLISWGMHTAIIACMSLLAFIYDIYAFGQVQEILQRNQDLKKLTTELEDATAHKNRFLAMISHDMRTPLNSVMGYLSLIQTQPDLHPETRQYAEQADLSAKHLLSVINDLLDVAQFNEKMMTIHPKAVNLYDTVQWVFDSLKPQAQDKQLRYELILENYAPLWVRMDAQRFAQILINLLSNAIKFTHQGGVSLRITTDSVPKQPSKVQLQATVEDSGIGIEPEQLEAVFKPFFQVKVMNNSHQIMPHEGFGLGLTISRQLARAMSGDISVRSQLGLGTTFVVSAVLDLAKAPAPATQLRERLLPPSDQPLHILIVDDHAFNRKVLSSTLHQSFAKVQIDEAANGNQALARIAEHAYDLVILDLIMPELSGIDVMHRIRQNPQPRIHTLPVLGLTANLASDALEECLASGMNEVMSKPFDRVILIEAITRLTRLDSSPAT